MNSNPHSQPLLAQGFPSPPAAATVVTVSAPAVSVPITVLAPTSPAVTTSAATVVTPSAAATAGYTTTPSAAVGYHPLQAQQQLHTSPAAVSISAAAATHNPSASASLRDAIHQRTVNRLADELVTARTRTKALAQQLAVQTSEAQRLVLESQRMKALLVTERNHRAVGTVQHKAALKHAIEALEANNRHQARKIAMLEGKLSRQQQERSTHGSRLKEEENDDAAFAGAATTNAAPEPAPAVPPAPEASRSWMIRNKIGCPMCLAWDHNLTNCQVLRSHGYLVSYDARLDAQGNSSSSQPTTSLPTAAPTAAAAATAAPDTMLHRSYGSHRPLAASASAAATLIREGILSPSHPLAAAASISTTAPASPPPPAPAQPNLSVQGVVRAVLGRLACSSTQAPSASSNTLQRSPSFQYYQPSMVSQGGSTSLPSVVTLETAAATAAAVMASSAHGQSSEDEKGNEVIELLDDDSDSEHEAASNEEMRHPLRESTGEGDDEESEEEEEVADHDDGEENNSIRPDDAISGNRNFVVYENYDVLPKDMDADKGRKGRPIAIDVAEQDETENENEDGETIEIPTPPSLDDEHSGSIGTTNADATVENTSDNAEEDVADDEEIKIVGETGKNALSDFAHPRYDCILKPFSKEPVTFCANCYCYVCDVKASECEKWKLSGDEEEESHCYADRSIVKWKRRRSRVRSKRNRPERFLKNIAFFLPDAVPVKLPSKRRKRETPRYGHDASTDRVLRSDDQRAIRSKRRRKS